MFSRNPVYDSARVDYDSKAKGVGQHGLRRTSFVPQIILAGLVLLIRGLIIGQPPFTDDGNYLSIAFLLWHHPFEVVPSLCPLSSINLYSVIFSWLFGFCSDGFVAFRAVDALLTALCTLVFYALIKQLSKSQRIAFFLTLLWVPCVNHPVFINAGFKNPFSPGFTCIFYAFLLLVRDEPAPPVFRIGFFLGTAFLFREPLIVFAAPVAYYLLIRGGLKSLLSMLAALSATIILGFIALGLIRGGDVATNTRNIVASWIDISAMHKTLLVLGHYDRKSHILGQLKTTLAVVGWALPVWLAGVGAAIFTFLKYPTDRATLVLAFLATVSPLPEFILKLGFPYHLSACFAGLAMISAIGLGKLSAHLNTPAKRLYFLALLPAVLFFPTSDGGNSLGYWTTGFRDAIRLSSTFLPVMVRDENSTEQGAGSFYLKASASIKRFSKPGDSILVSGFYGALYPLTGRMPPRLDVIDLTTYAFARGLSLTVKEREELNRNLPMLFIETNRYGEFDLKTLFDDFPRHYQLVDSIPEGPWHYGNFACKIYRRIDQGSK